MGTYVITAAHCRSSAALAVVPDPVDLCRGGAVNVWPLGEPVSAPPTVTEADIAVIPIDGEPKELRAPAPAAPGAYAVTGWGARLTDDRPCSARTLSLTLGDRTCPPVGVTFVCGVSAVSYLCNGDSGAGLIDDRGFVVAVASDGVGCTPGVGSRLALIEPHTQWFASLNLSLGS